MHLPEFDVCPMHLALWALGIGRIKIQCVCIGFVLFHLKKVNAHLLTCNHVGHKSWFLDFSGVLDQFRCTIMFKPCSFIIIIIIIIIISSIIINIIIIIIIIIKLFFNFKNHFLFFQGHYVWWNWNFRKSKTLLIATPRMNLPKTLFFPIIISSIWWDFDLQMYLSLLLEMFNGFS